MLLDPYHTKTAAGVRITPEQASRFAKEVAGDFNPIHDPDAKRFCVPGDLLFALVLERYGLSRRMEFRFRGMVGAGAELRFPESPGARIEIGDSAGRSCLEVERDGEHTADRGVIEAVIRRYVAFSGRNFPHYLQPLMAAEGVMFNPDRPLVIYDRMGFDLATPAVADPAMRLADSALDVQGRRAVARLYFEITDGGSTIGSGSKDLVISGLRDYDEARMLRFIEAFEARRRNHPFRG